MYIHMVVGGYDGTVSCAVYSSVEALRSFVQNFCTKYENI